MKQWHEKTKREAMLENRAWLRPENRKQAAETFARIAAMIAHPTKGRRAWPKDAIGKFLEGHIQRMLNLFGTEQAKPILDAYRARAGDEPKAIERLVKIAFDTLSDLAQTSPNDFTTQDAKDLRAAGRLLAAFTAHPDTVIQRKPAARAEAPAKRRKKGGAR